MSHLIADASPILGAHVVRDYDGWGILGANIPLTGERGASPAANDNTSPTAEYYWRVKTSPTAGVLTIYSDLTYTHDGAGVPAGVYPWEYELYENNVLAGTGVVYDSFGTANVAPANSQQSNQSSAASVSIQAIANITPSSSQVTNQSSGASASVPAIAQVAPANSRQISQSSSASVAVAQIAGLLPVSSQQSNQSSAGSASVVTLPASLIVAGNSQQSNQSSAGYVSMGPSIDISSIINTSIQIFTRTSPVLATSQLNDSIYNGSADINAWALYVDGSPLADHRVIYRLQLVIDEALIIDSQINPDWFDITQKDRISLTLGYAGIQPGYHVAALRVHFHGVSGYIRWETGINLQVYAF